MIGSAGYYEYMAGVRAGWDLNAVPNLKLGEKSLRGRLMADSDALDVVLCIR